MTAVRRCGAVLFALTMLAGCGTFRHRPELVPERGATQQGIASWYGPGFHGNATSSGEVYDQNDLTAAHQTLPLGTRVVVTNLDNHRSVEVRVNDRGPFAKERVIDLSYAAARSLDMIGPGTARVHIEVLGTATAALPATGYAVQIGSFSEVTNARDLQRTLQGRFDKVYLATLEAANQRYYRVRLGPFARREDAMATARRIQPLGLPALIMEDDLAAR